ncbi:MAG: YIP1 family protein [Bacillota bacterium]|uniref:YIP1 family protein n=1 Tax=Bacillus sp. RO2 TaxID=2723913 RepID=UPI00145EC02B|nr:YIP1 family protein [Bacillus sp. RO2]MEA3320904.1 YIP1 family protein [Bacillota bacterium]NMH71853.1 YIP1 family protein [Bacillus sp. RO2]
MNKLSSIFQAIFLDKEAAEKLASSEAYNKWAFIFTFVVGICYGSVIYLRVPEEYLTFDSSILQSAVYLFLLLSGTGMVYLTRLGLTLLLWAGGKAFGGQGFMGIINRLTAFALVPSIVGLPSIVALSTGEELSIILTILLVVSLLWMYFVSVRFIQISQKLNSWRAYGAVLIAFLFFSSVYYLILPPAA